ncbi:hypothetical protein NC653_028542 [Populus alba x Populus x berolinensis]|uniref:Uncharacterized protein n=1 Tax=Populus alba x Populus x berolinensis TaxID=444605 RepID=A0AAD6M0C7_9ROSI|nr:hypothetical protein NC653_028542 [Populus alba x Populus x berolinensis]
MQKILETHRGFEGHHPWILLEGGSDERCLKVLLRITAMIRFRQREGDPSLATRRVIHADVVMLMICIGGEDRTQKALKVSK